MDEGANRRRRSSLPEVKPAHFFKIMLPTTILDKKLRVPKTFVNHHGDDFSPIITLHDPNAREWKIGLEKIEEDDDLCFSEGWENFMEYYSITEVHFLVFRYEGDSKFQVLIFDMTGSEIQYPSQNSSPERYPVASSGSPKRNGYVHHQSQNHNDDNDGGGGGEGGGGSHHLSQNDNDNGGGGDGDDEGGGGGDHHQSQNHNDSGGRNQVASSGSPKGNNHVHHQSENHDDNNGGGGDHQNLNDNGGGGGDHDESGGRNQVASSESSKSNGHDHHWSQNYNDNDVGGSREGGGGAHCRGRGGDSYHFTEGYFPDDEDDSTHDAHEEDNFYYSISLSKSTSTSPSKSTSPATTKRRGFTKFIDQPSRRERRKQHSPPPSSKRKRREHSSDSESDEGSNSSRRRKKRRRSIEERRRGREKKSNHQVEWLRKQTLISKSYKKRHISERARTKVIEAADSYKPEFPSFRVVLRPHNLYNSIVYVPASFAVKYLGEGSGKIRLENVKGKQWEARCLHKNGSGNGMSIGEGWGKFKMDNEVKEGDVCVFELVKRRDIVLRVQIFRVRQYADR
ncbi:hypothetical protein K1719_000746 [Acacia pycnantha]|nr:hypothetical protein K1719_000746 [Acacia pycnantha]